MHLLAQRIVALVGSDLTGKHAPSLLPSSPMHSAARRQSVSRADGADQVRLIVVTESGIARHWRSSEPRDDYFELPLWLQLIEAFVTAKLREAGGAIE